MAVQLYAHLTWTTVDRRPMIGVREQQFLRDFLPAASREFGAEVIAVGIVSDHIHMIIGLPSEFSIPKLVQRLKGASARLANRTDEISLTGLRWARGYDLRSVSPWNLREAVRYVQHQASRHPDRAIPNRD